METTQLRRRMASAATAVVAAGGCPGPGVVNRLATVGDPDPHPCRGCGGAHVLVIEDLVRDQIAGFAIRSGCLP
jgi:hypothetical protein